MKPPRISIVTASFNQARFIRDTIESVLAQGYTDVEHIVVDGMSTDDTAQILKNYSHLKVVREPDRGQGDAINKGFALATGDIFAFLNSDDTLLPGALDRVAAEIDPAQGRHVVMGRCRFVDEKGRFHGVEHPSLFVDHADVLKIWNGHSIPQPAVFFTREAWETSGPMDPDERLVLDYDLFCRMSRIYPFHPIDQVLATYRLHADSKTSGMDDRKRLEESVRVSRKYWGPGHDPRRWRLEISYFMFRANRKGRAVRRLRQARADWSQGRFLSSTASSLAGVALGPDVFLDTFLVPWFRSFLGDAAGRVPPLQLWGKGGRPETSAWRDFRGVHSDGWAGPELVTKVDARPGHGALVLRGAVNWRSSARIDVYVDGLLCGGGNVMRKANFEIRIPMQVPAGLHEVRVTSSTWFVPDDFLNNSDFRPLAFQVAQLAFEGAAG